MFIYFFQLRKKHPFEAKAFESAWILNPFSTFVVFLFVFLRTTGSAKFADRIASDEASRGYPEAEKFAEKALHEGRKALAETVTMLEDALEE